MKVTTTSNNSRAFKKIDSFFLIFGSAWLLFGIVFCLVGYYMIKNEKLYQTSAVKTHGVLDSKFTTRSSGKNSSTSYKVRYHFTNDEGLEVSGEDSIDQELWSNLNEKDKINLEFIPGQSADKNRVAGGSNFGGMGGYIFGGVGLFISLLGLAFIVPYFRKRAKYKRLHAHGILVEGEVTGVGGGSLSINNVKQWQIKYSYKDSTGKLHDGKTEHMPPHEAQPWDRGDKCKVRYDKTNPASSIFVGK